MSLRPRTPGTRTALAQSRMAPGGRRWSEAPIPRVGRRRVRTATTPVVVPLYVGYRGTGDEPSLTLPTGATTGDVVVWVTFGMGGQATPPTGWTTLDSGAAGTLNWLIAYRTLTGGDSLEVSFAAATNIGNLWAFRGQGTALPVLAAAVSTATGVAAKAFVSAAGLLPWQCVGFAIPSPPVAYSAFTDPAELFDIIWISSAASYGSFFHTQPGEDPVSGNAITLGGQTGDWASFSVGFA